MPVRPDRSSGRPVHDIAVRLVVADEAGPDDVDTGSAALDVLVAVGGHHVGADLTGALAAYAGLAGDAAGDPVDDDQALHRRFAVRRTGLEIDPATPVDELDVLAGDEIIVRVDRDARAGDRFVDRGAERGSATPATSGRALALDVVAGPATGESFVLHHGATTIGRSTSADISIADPTVSRLHATLTVPPSFTTDRGDTDSDTDSDTDGRVELTVAPDAANGVLVDGDPVAAGVARSVRPGDVVVLGGTSAVVRSFERTASGQRDRLGQIAFHRTPYRPPIARAAEVDPVGPISTRPEPRRLQLVAVVAPLIAGVAMYLITRQAMFLLFTLISPVVMIGTAIDDRRTGRRSFADELDVFRAMLAERRSQFDDLAAAERRRRHRATPDVAELVRRAELRTIDLWQRGRDAPDVLHLRLGLGDDRAGFDVQLATGGDSDLRDEALQSLRGADHLAAVPVCHPLDERHLAVHGDPFLVDGVAAALALHTAVLHSPDDVAIALAVVPARHLDWTKWLPHLRAVTSPLAGAHLATDTAGANDLIDRLVEVAERRTADATHRRAAHWPRLVVVLDARLRPDPTAVARLLDLADDAGIRVIWLADRAAEVPRQAGSVMAVSQTDGARLVGRLWSTDPDVADRDVELDHVRPTTAERAARALAPIRDASTASLATAIPRTVPLFDVLGAPDTTSIATSWSDQARLALPFALGVGADGPVELDLVADGPHTLIGGTSGSGKSELLQSMVVALALRHSPARLNFLFVDYKGGASSQVFERLPHTVGYVTNLSADLARRALISLRAELERRMSLLAGRAKDLAGLLALDPTSAPPSLVIVVDEFATLVKEVPDFVTGIVDIAQRGRSLGIHLVLATQRPSGAVDENILANTNLRISLRMLDRAESSSILDSPDAAEIPAPLRGRALVRLGPRQLVEFQSAYTGAPTSTTVDRPPVVVGPFDRPDATVSPTAIHGPGTGSQLDAAIDAIEATNRDLRLSAPRRPWRETLPSFIRLADEVPGIVTEVGGSVTVGRFDAPERQDQGPATVDLESSGGLVVYGSGGSGKSTVLRTIAADIERRAAGAVTVVFDFGGRGLGALGDLSSVVDVAMGDDLEAVTRHLVVLDAELRRRTALLAASGAEHLTAHHRGGGDRLDRVVVLIDGFDVLADALLDPLASSPAGDSWSDLVYRLIVDGRRVGVHTVVTATRRAAVPTRLQAAIGARLVLRHADPQSYADLGVAADRAVGLDEIAGRAILDGVTVQVAVEGDDPSAQGQAAGLRRLASRTDTVGRVPHHLRSTALPERAEPVANSATDHRPAFALADVAGDTVHLDLEWSHAAIIGPSRSGRSTALLAALDSLALPDRPSDGTSEGTSDAAGGESGTCSGRTEWYVVGPPASPLARLAWPAGRSRFGRAAAVADLLDRVANRLPVIDPDDRVVLAVDDADAFDDPLLEPLWGRLLDHDSLRIVATMETRALSGYTASALIGELRRCRRLLVLQPDDPTEFLQLTGVRLALRPGLRLPPGRGVLLVDRRPVVVQTIDAATGRSRFDLTGLDARQDASTIENVSTVS